MLCCFRFKFGRLSGRRWHCSRHRCLLPTYGRQSGSRWARCGQLSGVPISWLAVSGKWRKVHKNPLFRERYLKQLLGVLRSFTIALCLIHILFTSPIAINSYKPPSNLFLVKWKKSVTTEMSQIGQTGQKITSISVLHIFPVINDIRMKA